MTIEPDTVDTVVEDGGGASARRSVAERLRAVRPSAVAAEVVPVLALWVPMLVWFLAFKPGIMTNDSVDVWGQVLSGDWVDWHPPVYTALQWVSYQLVGSPALATLAQTLALAWAMARVLRLAVRLGLPAPVVWIGGALVALTPPVGAFSVHLWKDVLYTVGLLLIVELFARCALGRLRLLADPSTRAYVLGGVGVVVVVLMRPNGVAVALATAVAIAVLARRRFVAVGTWVAAVVVAVAVQSLLYPALGVADPPPRLQAGIAPFDLGYLAVEHPETLDAEELALIDGLAPLERWRRDFSCHWTGTPMAEMAPADRVAEVRPELQAAWRRELTESTYELTLGHLCAASVAWNPIPSARERVRFEYLYTGIIDNELGLATTPVSERLHEVGLDVLESTMTSGWQPWFWRAPTWIYLCALAALVACVRARSGWLLVALAPFVAQQLSVIAMTGPHARYMLPAGIAAVMLLPALVRTAWMRPVRTEPDTPDGPVVPSGPPAVDPA
jgi:hypothetical protein